MALTPSLCENWAEVAEEEVSSQEWLGTQTMLADQCRESSASLPESFGSDSDWESTSGIWWTEMILDASKALGYSNPTNRNHIKVISGCTGISAEGWVFKAGLLLQYIICVLFLFSNIPSLQLLSIFFSIFISQFPHTSTLLTANKTMETIQEI